MLKSALFVLVVSAICFGQYSGVQGFDAVSGLTGTATAYSPWYENNSFGEIVSVVAVNDTSHAGFKLDSVNFVWGIQIGNRTKNSAGNLDTAIAQNVSVDTFTVMGADTVAHFATTAAICDSTGNIRFIKNLIDTTAISGLMSQTRFVKLGPNECFRYWFTGLAGNNGDVALVLRVNTIQKQYQHFKHR